MAIVRVTSRRNTIYVRRGKVAEVEWTPRIEELVAHGHLTLVSSPVEDGPDPLEGLGEAAQMAATYSRTELVEIADEYGLTVKAGDTKGKIAQAIVDAQQDQSPLLLVELPPEEVTEDAWGDPYGDTDEQENPEQALALGHEDDEGVDVPPYREIESSSEAEEE